VTDPGGIVKSQVVRTGDGALRIVLNGSRSQQTLSSRFLCEFVGSGVQHIAFATDDIVKTVQRLRARLPGLWRNQCADPSRRAGAAAARTLKFPVRPREGGAQR
jgi:hypothetical protein